MNSPRHIGVNKEKVNLLQMSSSVSTWSGFSEEDQAKIKLATGSVGNRVNGDNSKKLESRNGIANNKKPEVLVRPKQMKSNGLSHTPVDVTDKAQQQDLNGIPAEALLSRQAPESPVHVKLKIKEDSKSYEIMETAPQINGKVSEEPLGTNSIEISSPVDLTNGLEKKEPINLDVFEKRQKLFEEQNRLKKQMLAKALAMRKMKTEAEAQKIQQIQEELSKLDASLSNDVGILRSHIEIASAELAEAEKRYSKAEREFIEAKQLLFTKRERKDLLTEHLCTIIEQNEMRKAHRLTDLMVQLSDQDQIEGVTLNQIAAPDS